MNKYHIFEGLNPEKLTTIINKDVAPAHTEESLLYSESKGRAQAKQYMKDRLAHKMVKQTYSTVHHYNEES